MQNQNFDTQNVTGKNHEGPNANRPLRVLTASSIIGDKVENTKGEKIGQIKDIMLDVKNGKVEYVVIEFGGFLGIGEKLFAVPYSALKLNPANEDFIINIEKEFLKNAPGFDSNHWPETNEHYEDVNAHWGDFMGPSTGGNF